jgi:hypothetical protein
MQRWFTGRSLVFFGPTKKIVYAGGLEGQPVLPVQVVTSAVFGAAGALGLYLHLQGLYAPAMLSALTITQLWRVLSEFLRADHRGGGRLTTYQWMSLFAIAYGAAMVLLWPSPAGPAPILSLGLATLWNPGVILFLQGVWLLVMLHSGRSRVTGAHVHFFVNQEMI